MTVINEHKSCAQAIVRTALAKRARDSAYSPGAVAAKQGLLRLDRNEGPAPSRAVIRALGALPGDALQRYPSAAPLEAAIAARIDVAPERVVVTAGGDDALDRLIRMSAQPGGDLLIHSPTFAMIERAGDLAQASVRKVPWENGPFPIEEFVEAIDRRVGCVALVSPNNPTGLVIARDMMLAVAKRASEVGALVVVDLAYVEYADDDPTQALLEAPNVAVVRTFSKAWGLAGLRVGWLAASPVVAGVARTLGGPFAVAGPSLALAQAALEESALDMRAHVSRVQWEREELRRVLLQLGVEVSASQANFVLARFGSRELAMKIATRLAQRSVIVRTFASSDLACGALRITCPGDDGMFSRLVAVLREVVSALTPNSDKAEESRL